MNFIITKIALNQHTLPYQLKIDLHKTCTHLIQITQNWVSQTPDCQGWTRKRGKLYEVEKEVHSESATGSKFNAMFHVEYRNKLTLGNLRILIVTFSSG